MDKILYIKNVIPKDFTGWTNNDSKDINLSGQLILVKNGKLVGNSEGENKFTTKAQLLSKSKLGKLIYGT